jgi:chemotaxis protein CheX
VTESNLKPVTQQGTVDVRFINPFINATVNVMRTMTGITVARKDIALKTNFEMVGDISALIGISGEHLEGTVAISFDRDIGLSIIGRMLGCDPGSISDADLRDGVGEIVNMIAGNAKTSLASEGDVQLRLTLPTVVTGSGHGVTHCHGTPCIVLTFEFEEGQFTLEVAAGNN